MSARLGCRCVCKSFECLPLPALQQHSRRLAFNEDEQPVAEIKKPVYVGWRYSAAEVKPGEVAFNKRKLSILNTASRHRTNNQRHGSTTIPRDANTSANFSGLVPK